MIHTFTVIIMTKFLKFLNTENCTLQIELDFNLLNHYDNLYKKSL